MLAFICFGAGLEGALFGDDFLYLLRDAAPSPLWFFSNANPLHIYAYRPLEFAFIWITQEWSPDSTLMLHSSQLALHLIAGGMIVWVLRNLGYERRVSVLAGLFLLVSQGTVHAVMSGDTISQQFSAVFGCASLFGLHRSVTVVESSQRIRYQALSSAFFLLSLLGKEVGMSILATMGLYLGYRLLAKKIGFRSVVAAFVPLVLVAVFYMAVRRSMGLPSGQFGARPIDFNLGVNLFVNPILALVQAAMPFSSVDVFLALKGKLLGQIALACAGVGVVLGLPLLGFFWSGRLRQVVELAGLFFSSICVVFLMNHISELYVYSALPFFAAFFAIGINHLRQMLTGRLRFGLYALVIGIVSANIFACRSKVAMMVELGDRAARLRPQVERVLTEAPLNARIVFVNPISEIRYSVYRQEGFTTLSELPHAYKILKNREDLDVAIVGYSDQGVEPTEGVSYYTYDRDLKLVPYSRKD